MKINWFLPILACLLVLSIVMPVMGLTFIGTGSNPTPYLIRNTAEWLDMTNHTGSGYYTMYVLTNDLDFTNIVYTPQRMNTLVWIDGQGHTISNISYSGTGVNINSRDQVGIISYQGANTKLYNLIIKNCSFTYTGNGSVSIGTLMGSSLGYSISSGASTWAIFLDNKSGVKVVNPSTSVYMGGVAGQELSGGRITSLATVNYSVANGADTSAYVGGFVGYNSFSGCNQCIAGGLVNVPAANAKDGGFVGYGTSACGTTGSQSFFDNQTTGLVYDNNGGSSTCIGKNTIDLKTAATYTPYWGSNTISSIVSYYYQFRMDSVFGYPVFGTVESNRATLESSTDFQPIGVPVDITFNRGGNTSSYYRVGATSYLYSTDSFTMTVYPLAYGNNLYQVSTSSDNATWSTNIGEIAYPLQLYLQYPSITQTWSASTHTYPYNATHTHSGSTYAYGYYKHDIYYYADTSSNRVLMDTHLSISESEGFSYVVPYTGYYEYVLSYSSDGITYFEYDSETMSITGFTGAGSGTVGTPYIITNAEQLQSMRYNLDSYFILANDIDLSTFPTVASPNFTSVGTSSAQFTGGFDGNQKYITGMTTKTGGLFGYVAPAAPLTRDVIHDFILISPKITSTASLIGGVANSISYTTDPGANNYLTYSGIRRVGIVGGFINDTAGSYIGNIFGYATGYYDGMYVYGTLTAARDCFSTMEIKASNSGAYISGIGMGNIVQIKDVYASGKMFDGNNHAYHDTWGTARDGGVICTSSTLAHFTETNTFYDITVSGQTSGYDGTYGYTHAQMKVLTNFGTWDLATTWKSSGASSVLEGMPIFQWSSAFDEPSPTPTPTPTPTATPTPTTTSTVAPTTTWTPVPTGTPTPPPVVTKQVGISITSAIGVGQSMGNYPITDGYRGNNTVVLQRNTSITEMNFTRGGTLYTADKVRIYTLRAKPYIENSVVLGDYTVELWQTATLNASGYWNGSYWYNVAGDITDWPSFDGWSRRYYFEAMLYNSTSNVEDITYEDYVVHHQTFVRPYTYFYTSPGTQDSAYTMYLSMSSLTATAYTEWSIYREWYVNGAWVRDATPVVPTRTLANLLHDEQYPDTLIFNDVPTSNGYMRYIVKAVRPSTGIFDPGSTQYLIIWDQTKGQPYVVYIAPPAVGGTIAFVNDANAPITKGDLSKPIKFAGSTENMDVLYSGVGVSIIHKDPASGVWYTYMFPGYDTIDTSNGVLTVDNIHTSAPPTTMSLLTLSGGAPISITKSYTFTSEGDYKIQLIGYESGVYTVVDESAILTITKSMFNFGNVGDGLTNIFGGYGKYLIGSIIVFICMLLPFLVVRTTDPTIAIFGGVLGVIISFALGLFDVWILFLLGLLAAAVIIFGLSGRGGGGSTVAPGG